MSAADLQNQPKNLNVVYKVRAVITFRINQCVNRLSLYGFSHTPNMMTYKISKLHEGNISKITDFDVFSLFEC